jgi:Ser-tRNA(Ala) deacylase AlaX
MQMIYHTDSYCREIETTINSASVFEGRTELECEDLLFHPAGGGQPDDLGSVILQGKTYKIATLRKHKGATRLVLDDDGAIANETGFGETVICLLDWKRRQQLMRLHSAAHVLMASARKTVTGYVPSGMQIADNLETATIRFKCDQEPTPTQFEQIFSTAAETVRGAHEISSIQFPNLEVARTEGKDLFRIDPAVQLKGEVRIVRIDKIDFNPCSGTHVRNTIDIGKIEPAKNQAGDQLTEIQYSVNPICDA